MAAPPAERLGKARGDLRVELVERQDLIRNEAVAGAVGAMEAGRVALGKGADQRADPIRVRKRESLVVRQRAHRVERIR